MTKGKWDTLMMKKCGTTPGPNNSSNLLITSVVYFMPMVTNKAEAAPW